MKRPGVYTLYTCTTRGGLSGAGPLCAVHSLSKSYSRAWRGKAVRDDFALVNAGVCSQTSSVVYTRNDTRACTQETTIRILYKGRAKLWSLMVTCQVRSLK